MYVLQVCATEQVARKMQLLVLLLAVLVVFNASIFSHLFRLFLLFLLLLYKLPPAAVYATASSKR